MLQSVSNLSFRTARPITTRGGGVTLNDRTGEGLTLDQIASSCPAVFADGAHESRSARYEFTDTREVLQGLIREGFKVAEVRQGGSRIKGKAAFTKHAIRLTAPDVYTVQTRTGDKSAAQVVLRNSHDGTSAYGLRAGLYRYVCLNGLMIGDDIENFKVGHTAGARDKIIDAAFRVVQTFPLVTDQVNRFAGLDLNRDEAMAFAESALMLRWNPAVDSEGEAVEVTDTPKAAPIEAVRLLDPRRAADQGPALWNVMNRVQENLIRGGQRYVNTGHDARGRPTRQRRAVGAVQSIDQDSTINRALWTLTAKMAELKAA